MGKKPEIELTGTIAAVAQVLVRQKDELTKLKKSVDALSADFIEMAKKEGITDEVVGLCDGGNVQIVTRKPSKYYKTILLEEYVKPAILAKCQAEKKGGTSVRTKLTHPQQ